MTPLQIHNAVSTIATAKPMNLPTAMTDTYATNLLRDGKNDLFDLIELDRKVCHAAEDPDVILSTYYSASVIVTPKDTEPSLITGVGPTPRAAVRRALEKHGVTFRA